MDTNVEKMRKNLMIELTEIHVNIFEFIVYDKVGDSGQTFWLEPRNFPQKAIFTPMTL